MKKILFREQIQEADRYTMENEPIESIDLMERASRRFAAVFMQKISPGPKIFVFCGKGNNGGDGLDVSRILAQAGYSVTAIIVHYSQKSSQDFEINFNRLPSQVQVIHINSENDFPSIEEGDIVIDALWGTGLTRPIKGFARNIIQKINDSGAFIVALDIPSGTYCDFFNPDDAKVKAQLTISFAPPKLAFFIPENYPYVGEWHTVDIHFDDTFIRNCETPYSLIEKQDILKIFRLRKAFDHKGTFGHALLAGGSYGKMGAIVLASRAAVRAGSGLVSALIPECGYNIVQSTVPEAMCFTAGTKYLKGELPDKFSKINALGMGPGMGTMPESKDIFARLLSLPDKKFVIDADGLNLLNTYKDLITLLPSETILTPHIGEFDRLSGSSENHFERLKKLQNFSRETGCIVVLKGKFSAIAFPDGNIMFNPTGNPGMATGGSGDVLTGIIAGMLASGYSPRESALMGAYIHGLAGDMCALQKSQTSMSALDIINYLPTVFLKLEKESKGQSKNNSLA